MALKVKVEMETLIGVLDREIVIYRELLELARQKQACIGDAEALPEVEAINAREVQLAQAIAQAERERLQVTDTLTDKTGSQLAVLSLVEIAETVGAPYDQPLLERRQLISQLLADLKAVNALNQQLLEQELSYINLSLQLITGNDESKQGYSELGRKQQNSSQRSVLDWKA